MATDFRTGRRTLGATPSSRRRLSNITNLVNVGSWSNENELVKSIYNSGDLQLQQEIKKLEQINCEKDMIIAEKDQEIESQKLFMHKMQREFYTNICKRSQQNEEIIGFNTRLSKELSFYREQLKLFHHEYTQMALVYKVNEHELQTKLAETQEQLKRAEKKYKGSIDVVEIDEIPSNVTRRTRNSSGRRHSMIGEGLDSEIWNPSTKTDSISYLDTTSTSMRAGVRSKATASSQKASSSKSKIRQNECAAMPIIDPYFPTPVPACSSKRFNNRYGHLNNLEPMQELEESELLQPSTTPSRRCQRNPSLEYSSSEAAESEIFSSQSDGSEQLAGEVASTSESSNAGRVFKAAESRPAIKAQRNPYDKNPPQPDPAALSSELALNQQPLAKGLKLMLHYRKKLSRNPVLLCPHLHCATPIRCYSRDLRCIEFLVCTKT